MKRNKSIYIIAIWAMILMTVNGFGQTVVDTNSLVFSLKEARDYAVEHSYNTRKSALDIDVAEKKVKEIIATGLPQISASADFRNNIQLPTSLVPDFTGQNPGTFTKLEFGTNYSLNASLSATQMIFDGSYIVGLEAARVYKKLSENQLIQSEQEIQDQVTRAYGNVIVSVENYETLKWNKTFLEQTLEETEQLFKNGFSSQQDVDQLTILVQTAVIEFNKADRLRMIFDNTLKFTMGIESVREITLTDSLQTLIAYGNDSSVNEQLFDVNANIDYEVSVTNENLKMLEYKKAKSDFLPTLDGFYNYLQSYQANDLDFNGSSWFPGSYWGLHLDVPIFSGGQKHFIKQQAEINWQKSRVELVQSEEGLLVDFLNVKSDHQFAVEEYKNSKDNLSLVTRIVSNEMIKYQEGTSSSLNLANAQIQYFQIQGAYVQSIIQMINSRSALDKILSNY